MKKYEFHALNNSKKYKNWDLICVSKDSYLEGYRQALADYGIEMSNETVEVEFKNGSHQLTRDTLTNKK